MLSTGAYLFYLHKPFSEIRIIQFFLYGFSYGFACAHENLHMNRLNQMCTAIVTHLIRMGALLTCQSNH